MNRKRFIFRRLIGLALVSALLCTGAPAYENASDWAEPELLQAEAHGLLDGALLQADVSRPITRLEFCAVVMRLYERLAGPVTEIPVGAAFSDCADEDVLRAAGLGIVNGVAPGVFAPDAPVEKQQLAVMLCRALLARGWQPNAVDTPPFADDGQIAPYARESVYYLRALDILRGDEHNRMGAADSVSVEQAVILALRVCRLAYDPAAEGMERLPVGARAAWLGMTETGLTAVFGAPEERLASGRGYDWLVFGAREEYRAFFLAGVRDETVVALYGAGPGLSYPAAQRDVKMEQAAMLTTVWNGYQVTQYYDNAAEGMPLHAVLLESDARGTTGGAGDFGRISYHMTNAYRAGSGLPPLGWSDGLAAVAARQASYMAGRGLADDTGYDGKALSERLTDAGVRWASAGENVDAAEEGNLPAIQNAWINGAASRAHLLSRDFTWFGAAAARGIDGRLYAAQELCEN